MSALASEKQLAKRESRDLVRDAGGTEAAAMDCRLGKSMLSLIGRPDNEHFIPIDAIMDLEDVTVGKAGHPRLTRMLAARQNFALVKLPTGELCVGTSLHQALAESIREASELHQALCAALSDGVVDADEAAAIERLALDAAEASMRVATLAKQIRETR